MCVCVCVCVHVWSCVHAYKWISDCICVCVLNWLIGKFGSVLSHLISVATVMVTGLVLVTDRESWYDSDSAEANLTLSCFSLQKKCTMSPFEWQQSTMSLVSTLGSFCVFVVKNVSCGAVWKSGCVCLPPDIFPLSLMGLNVAVGRCSCQLNTYRAKRFCPIASRDPL